MTITTKQMVEKYHVRIKGKQLQTNPELWHVLSSASGLMKELMGVANNAAWLVCLDAYDKLKTLKNWRQKVKGGYTVSQEFKRVFDEFHAYERRLIYDNDFGFFDLKNFPESTKRMYGNISNRDYYDFWAAIGGSTYERTKPLISSLWNKYRLALVHNKIKDDLADTIAWGMCACACLNAAVTIWGMSLDMISEEFTLPRHALELDFKYFNLKDVAKLWEDALEIASPQCFNTVPNETDDKNINDGLKQIMQQWTEGKGIYDDMEKTIRDCGEDVLKTQGFIKKAINEVKELRDCHDTL